MLRIASLTFTAALAVVAGAGAARHPGSHTGWTNVSNHGGWIAVQRNREPMIEGSGRLVRQARTIGGFDSVHVMGPTRLELVVGPRYSLEVVADDNVAQLITSEVEDGELKIDTRGSFRTRTVPAVRITSPRIERVKLQGSGDGLIEGLSGGSLELVSQGSGDLKVSGKASSIKANLYGSGNADLTRVLAPDVHVAVFGSGDARVHAPNMLSASVFGSGTIAYSGSPSQLRRSVHGSGSIDPVRQ